ncbi:hypothetical protein ACIQCD_30380 [Streptomyces sp. NPDC093250]|uniref:hypothetical protein n=1 Tax=unclassified Streptomyces TaxID=2593676 RepID=UPI003414D054
MPRTAPAAKVRDGRTLRARAEVAHAGRRDAVVRVAMLCAVAQGTVAPVPSP